MFARAINQSNICIYLAGMAKGGYSKTPLELKILENPPPPRKILKYPPPL